MSASERYQWRRDKDGLGVWEHRGKVAVAGVGHSPVDRRWDGVSMDQTVGAYSILACRKAMDEAGVAPEQIEGVICCDSHIAGGSGGSASQWAPRPYFAPPYDLEWGLTLVNAKWLIDQMRLPNVKFAPTGVPTISEMVGMAAQAVGDGQCHTCLVIYPTGNLEGRYRRGGENADDYARGARQWTAPWGNHGGNDFINIFPHNQYCLKYGGQHDDLAPFVVNQHRNGLLTPWGYNATHNVPQLTIEDYVNSRYILNPLRLWDCDRPVNASTAYLFTTAERARDMRQAPVYVLNHSQHNFRKRSTQEDLDEIEDWTDRAAKRMYEGAGLGPATSTYSIPTTAMPRWRSFSSRASSGTASNAATPSHSTRATSGSRDRTRSARAAATSGPGACAPPCTPTASSSSAAPPAPARSRFRQRRHWRHSPRPAAAAGSCSATPRADGL